MPGKDAMSRSHALRDLLCQAISQADGWLPFAQFMQMALYAPGLGYYVAGEQKFGPGGDFQTASGITPLFAKALARQASEIMQLTAPVILEVGAGDGQLAADLLSSLVDEGQLPDQYLILELSSELQARQRDTISLTVPHHIHLVHWLSELPGQFSGLAICNEVLDAMPAHLIVWDNPIQERGVALGDESNFCWQDKPAKGRLLKEAQQIGIDCGGIPDGYQSEIALLSQDWVACWAEIMQSGVLLLCDYGFPRREFYHPVRQGGTLMCHYRQRSHGDPFWLPGLQDISVHVDFTALISAAHAQGDGLSLYGYTSQAQALYNCGILDLLAALPPESQEYFSAASSVNRLCSPSEMGELFKWMALGRGLELADNKTLLAFAHGDKSHTL